MKARNMIKASLIAMIAAGAAMANAATNPLDPGYYAEKFAAVAPAVTGAKTTIYRDINNPTSPSYSRNGSDAAWTQTSDVIGAGYDQSANPLHPTFKRQ